MLAGGGIAIAVISRKSPTLKPSRTLFPVAAFLLAAAWALACGDGGVEPPPPDSPRPTTVTVSPATAELTALDATVRLTAEVRDQNGQAIPGADVTWTSGAEPVATVSAAGLVTAAGNGTATITATAGSASGTASVTVAQVVVEVAVSPATGTVVAGDTLRLVADAADANGHSVAGTEFAWASADTTVAMVDASGLVTGVRAGEVEIAATAAGATGRAALVVAAPTPTAVAVTPATVAFTALGQTVQLAAEVRDQIGRAMTGVAVSWASVDTLVATVGAAGLVTAVAGGATAVTAMAGEAAGEAAVNVMQSAGSVVVTPSSDTIAPADSLRLVAEAFDENGHRVDGAAFNWSSSDTSAARVDHSGLVTGVAEGTATITASSGSASGTSEIAVQNPDRAALVALYEATDGPNWVSSDNWLTDAPLAEWHGITTDPFGRVVRLDLAGRWDSEARVWVRHGLTGSIPSELASLTQLRTLHLDSNRLTGSIPPELGNLSNLRELNLYNNDITGPIPPEFGNLTKLTGLWLGNNDVTGPIPPRIGELVAIESLSLFNNRLDGPLPSELGNLSRLRDLHVSGNRLEGPVPPEIGGLGELLYLRLGRNAALSGPLPATLSGLTSLRILGFEESGLCAPATESFQEWLRGVETVRGDNCTRWDAAVLTSFYEATNGEGWKKSGGWLGDGPLDEWYGVTADSLGRVVALDLSRNGLAGQIPPALGDLANLKELRLSHNSLSGPIPSALGDLAKLTGLYLDNNRLEGPVPPEIGGLDELMHLRLGGNASLAGPLPPTLTGLTELRELGFEGTGLCASATESFREWLRGLETVRGDSCAGWDAAVLASLYEATNGQGWIESGGWLGDGPLEEWHGVTTDSVGRVVALDLSGNGLAGELPLDLGDLDRLTDLRVGGNGLAGGLPLSLARLPLQVFRYADTELCDPSNESFRAWLNAIPSLEGTGVQCTTRITHVEPAVLVEGEAATITGSGFSRSPEGNNVLVDGLPATVLSAAATRLTVSVPRADCLPPREVVLRVSTSEGSDTVALGATPLTAEDLNWDRFDWRHTSAGDGCIHLPGSARGGEYLIGVTSVSEDPSRLVPVTLAGIPGDASIVGASRGGRITQAHRAAYSKYPAPLVSSSGPVSPSTSVAGDRLHDARGALEPPRGDWFVGHAEAMARNEAVVNELGRPNWTVGATAEVSARSTLAEGDTVTLNTICCGNPRVRAIVRLVTDHFVWLDDDLANPTGPFTDDELTQLDAFYSDHAKPVHEDYFGGLSDVDGNGRILHLMTIEMNRLGHEGLNPCDLHPRDKCQWSNEAEIVYSFMPDPDGSVGPAVSRETLLSFRRQWLTHEVAHLVQHAAWVFGEGPRKQAWELEGGAVLSEQLVGQRLFGHSSGQNLGYPGYRAGQGWYGWLGSLFDFFSGGRGAPEECTWLTYPGRDGNDGPCESDLNYQVGSLVLRFAMDRWAGQYPGGEKALVKRLTQSPLIGFANLVDASPGWSIERFLGEFYATLWLEGTAGQHAGMTYWDLHDIVSRFDDVLWLKPYSSTEASPSVSGRVRAGSTLYFHWTPAGPLRPTSFKAEPAGEGPFFVWAIRAR